MRNSPAFRHQPRPFLTAQWRDLIMVNYRVDPDLLQPWVPRGTSLDLWAGEALISLVAFKFLDTRVLGFRLPGYRNFEEVNLRFYVRRDSDGDQKRGVVFIREWVPKRMISWVANTVYNEHYATIPMRHSGRYASDGTARISYEFKVCGKWNSVAVQTTGAATIPQEDSQLSFIAEHYWGYSQQRDGSTMEYQVEHPPWKVDTLIACDLQCDAASVYGSPWGEVFAQGPISSFLAVGSDISVQRGRKLQDTL